MLETPLPIPGPQITTTAGASALFGSLLNTSPNPLQETDKLEDEKSGLQREIEELQKQKERLELVLEAHRPICKIPEGPKESNASSTSGTSSPPAPSRPVPCISLSPGPVLEPEALHTPTLMTTPSLTPFTPSPIFTYPSTPEPCASAHRRSSSSSGDPSSDPLGSPTLLAL